MKLWENHWVPGIEIQLRTSKAFIRPPSSRNGFKERSLLFGDSCIFEVRAICFSAKCTRWIPLMSRWVPPLISSTVRGYALPDLSYALDGTDICTRKLSALNSQLFATIRKIHFLWQHQCAASTLRVRDARLKVRYQCLQFIPLVLSCICEVLLETNMLKSDGGWRIHAKTIIESDQQWSVHAGGTIQRWAWTIKGLRITLASERWGSLRA